MTPRLYIPIAGTWSRSHHNHAGAWYRFGSPFDALLAGHGYRRVEQDRDPETPDSGYWSGDLNGLLIQRLAWWRDKHPAWRDGARELSDFLRRRQAEFTGRGITLIAHSHGGQVVAYALASLTEETRAPLGRISVVTVDMPVRRDMADAYQAAAAQCDHWVHLYSQRGWRSRFRWLGNRFGRRLLAGAHHNVEVAGGHSGILSDARYMTQWHTILARLEET